MLKVCGGLLPGSWGLGFRVWGLGLRGLGFRGLGVYSRSPKVGSLIASILKSNV